MAKQHLLRISCAMGVWLMTTMATEVQAQLLLSPTGQPDEYDLHFSPPPINGWGAARFGMTVAEVRAVLARAYPQVEVLQEVEPVQRTMVLNLLVPGLSPVEGLPSQVPATLNYVFGASSERLMAINLDWYVEGQTLPEQREAILAMGSAYTAKLAGANWADMQTARGHVVGPGAVILFAGRDENNYGVQVLVEGIALDVLLPPNGEIQRRPAPTGGAHLHIGLSAMPDDPDVYSLPDNSF